MAFKSLKARFTESSHDFKSSVKAGRGHAFTKKLAQWIVEEKAITTAHKGLNTAHNNLAASVYKFGHADGAADMADVFDKMSWILAELGTLHETFGTGKHEDFRKHLKVIRNAEDDLTKERNERDKVADKLQKEKNKGPGKWDSTTLEQLENELLQYENSLMGPEAQVEHTKRTQLVAGLDENFDGLIELGEKLALLAGYGKLLSNHINQDYVNHGTEREPYNDERQTSKILKAAQDSLAKWTPQTSAPALGEELGEPSSPVGYRDSHGANMRQDDDDESVSGSTVGGGSTVGSRNVSGVSHRAPSSQDASTGGSAPQLPAKGGLGEVGPPSSSSGGLDGQTRDLSLSDEAPSSNNYSGSSQPVSGPGAFLGSLSAPTSSEIEDEAPGTTDTGAPQHGTNGPSHGSFERRDTGDDYKDAHE